MSIIRTLVKYFSYGVVLGSILWYLASINMLIPTIFVASVLYLLVYFSIGTIAVFSTINEIGKDLELDQSFGLNYLMNLLAVIIFTVVLWIVCLIFWPLLAIPDNALHRKRKYKSIVSFEEAVKKKYGASQVLVFNDDNPA